MAKLLLTAAFRKHADRASWVLRLLWLFEGGLLVALSRLSRIVSPDRASSAGRRLMRVVGSHLEKTRNLRRNLRIAFPEKNEREIEDLMRELWGNVGAVLAEFPHLGTIVKGVAGDRLEIVHNSNACVFQDNAKPAIFVSAHLANWEIASGAIVAQGVPFTGIYTPLQNPMLDRMLYRARLSLGYTLVSRDGAMRKLIKSLRKGVSVGLLVDQRVDSGEPVPFFGHDMTTSTTPAQLALRFGCELIPVQVQRREGARFRVIFHEPIQPDDTSQSKDDQILQMTRKINTLFEMWIRERPGEWYCAKRRWPKNTKPIRNSSKLT